MMYENKALPEQGAKTLYKLVDFWLIVRTPRGFGWLAPNKSKGAEVPRSAGAFGVP